MDSCNFIVKVRSVREKGKGFAIWNQIPKLQILK